MDGLVSLPAGRPLCANLAGSFLEFIPIFKLLTSTYTPDTLPIHLVCPSLIGFGFSSPPPRHDRFTNLDVCDLWDQLMRGLGFSSYTAQGGDIGSFVTQMLAQKFDACKGEVAYPEWSGLIISDPPQHVTIT
jgi:pimeloyl-ACP methyl ester carboxylesterase